MYRTLPNDQRLWIQQFSLICHFFELTCYYPTIIIVLYIILLILVNCGGEKALVGKKELTLIFSYNIFHFCSNNFHLVGRQFTYNKLEL